MEYKYDESLSVKVGIYLEKLWILDNFKNDLNYAFEQQDSKNSNKENRKQSFQKLATLFPLLLLKSSKVRES